tara:strand:+ start:533 stop:763 length:231 start_codon:yes stop_codon:yes gene_type:complete
MAQKGKKKAVRAMKEILKTPKSAAKVVKSASKHWNDIEEFRKSVEASGLPLDVEAEFEFFKSDPESFKKTNTYKNL